MNPMNYLNRRESILASLAISTVYFKSLTRGQDPQAKLRHSVCRAPFAKIPMDEFCEAVKAIGIESIELLEPHEYPVVQKHGLQCAMGRFVSTKLPASHIEAGWNRIEHHEVLLSGYEELIQKTADAGFRKVICFSGLRKGMDDRQGIENCALGISKLMPLCERLGVTMCMELLNSKVNHADYMGDNSPFGIALCDKIGSPHFRILYDIYHMQIMEGNVIATIRKNHEYFAHYHTAGVPGRHEIDDSQELNYGAIVRAILETGYRDFLGQEFSPTRPDKLASLKQAIGICTPTI